MYASGPALANASGVLVTFPGSTLSIPTQRARSSPNFSLYGMCSANSLLS